MPPALANKNPVDLIQVNPLTSYLWDPISQGVSYCRLSIDQPAVRAFAQGVLSRVPKELRSVEEDSLAFRRSATSLSLDDLVEDLDSLDDLTVIVRRAANLVRDIENPDLLQYIAPALNWIAFVNNVPPLRSISQPTKQEEGSPGSRIRRKRATMPIRYMIRPILRGKTGLFDTNLPLAQTQDAIHLTVHEHREASILDVSSVRKDGLSAFLRFLSIMPEIKSGLKVMTRRNHFSSRVVFDPYAAAASAWIQGRSAAEYLPRYVLDYLKAALGYSDSREWRTSIVLCSIATETLLAELYEDQFHKQAPDIPLGALKERIIDSSRQRSRGSALPSEIVDWIDKVNTSRIGAVHRGSRELSARDAFDAHRGLVKIALWYYYKSQSAPERTTSLKT